MSSGYELVSIFFTLSQSKVLDGVGFWATVGATAHAGGLVADPVSDNLIRFHERTRFLLLRSVPFPLRESSGKGGC